MHRKPACPSLHRKSVSFWKELLPLYVLEAYSISMPKGKHLSRITLNCANCRIVFSKVASDNDRRHCSWDCAKVSKRKPILPRKCIGCNTLFTPTKHNGTYCRKGCVSHSKARHSHEQGIFQTARAAKQVLLGSLRACQRCGWNVEPAILELHHKDRNRKNNHITNLTVICPNCHALDHYKQKDGQYFNNLGRVA